MISPIKDFESIDELKEQLGFDVSLPNDYVPNSFTTISDRIMQFHDKDGICFRKALFNSEYSEDMGISGVYPGGYPSDCVLNYDSDLDAYIRENNDKAYVAIFNRQDDDKKYSYSIFARDGIAKDKMRTFIKQFCWYFCSKTFQISHNKKVVI